MKLIYISDVYYKKITVEYDKYGIYYSFTGAHKIIHFKFYYCLSARIAGNAISIGYAFFKI